MPGSRRASSTSSSATAPRSAIRCGSTRGWTASSSPGRRVSGLRIHQGLSQRWIKPALLELGGKNAAIVMDTADLDAAAEGVMRSAFGLQGQKCSATSRVYVHRAVRQPFVDKLLEKTAAIRIGDPTERDVYLGPVINREGGGAVRAGGRAGPERREAAGGRRTAHGRGRSARVTTWRPRSSSCRGPARSSRTSCSSHSWRWPRWEASTRRSPRRTRWSTASPPASSPSKPEEVERFFDEIEAGVCYANKRTGATTGAWPGAQAFCGWKGSGSTGKGGCGPYYVAQFMREQSRTVIENC